MSKPVTIRTIKTDHSTSGAITTKINLFYSDGTKDQIEASFNATDEQRQMLVAHHLLDVNSPLYRHNLLPGHVRTLAKFKRAIVFHGVNSVHRRRDLDAAGQSLTKDEEANLTYLCYFGLLVPDKHAEKGFWLITTKGNDFLTGQLVIEKVALVKNNTVKGHEGPWVSITDVWVDSPTWPSAHSLDMEVTRREFTQGALL